MNASVGTVGTTSYHASTSAVSVVAMRAALDAAANPVYRVLVT